MQEHRWSNNKTSLEEMILFTRKKFADSGLQIERKHAIGIAVLVALVLSGSLVLHFLSQPKPVTVSKAGSNPKEVAAKEKPIAGENKDQPVFVHVAGAVENPGVYRLKEGSRAIDALDIAGGALDHSDVNTLNLAAKVFDGQRIYVPKKGEVAVKSEIPGDAGMALNGGGKINLNAATPDQLDLLPGVGEVTAKKIIEFRNKNGPFKKVEDLKKIEGIGDKKYNQIKDRACVN